MRSTYQLRLGARPIGLREATSAQEAVLDYIRAQGCCEQEIVRLGTDAASWRGAVYKAVPASSDLVESRPCG
jgi:hypothetical protein